MEDIILKISFVIAMVGAFVIVWGVLLAVIEFVVLEVRKVIGHKICVNREPLRHHLGSYLLLGLEILIAADVITTIVEPTFEEVTVLAVIVVIRTILNFFLHKELDDGHKCEG